jgi:hypothetical protein
VLLTLRGVGTLARCCALNSADGGGPNVLCSFCSPDLDGADDDGVGGGVGDNSIGACRCVAFAAGATGAGATGAAATGADADGGAADAIGAGAAGDSIGADATGADATGADVGVGASADVITAATGVDVGASADVMTAATGDEILLFVSVLGFEPLALVKLESVEAEITAAIEALTLSVSVSYEFDVLFLLLVTIFINLLNNIFTTLPIGKSTFGFILAKAGIGHGGKGA